MGINRHEPPDWTLISDDAHEHALALHRFGANIRNKTEYPDLPSEEIRAIVSEAMAHPKAFTKILPGRIRRTGFAHGMVISVNATDGVVRGHFPERGTDVYLVDKDTGERQPRPLHDSDLRT